VKAAFDDATKAREDGARIIKEAEAYSNDIPAGTWWRRRGWCRSAGLQASVMARAEGDRAASRRCRRVRQGAGVTRDRMYIETMEQSAVQHHQDPDRPEGQKYVLFLPLDRMLA